MDDGVNKLKTLVKEPHQTYTHTPTVRPVADVETTPEVTDTTNKGWPCVKSLCERFDVFVEDLTDYFLLRVWHVTNLVARTVRHIRQGSTSPETLG